MVSGKAIGRTAGIVAAASIAYLAFGNFVAGKSVPAPIEQGYANPAHVEFYEPVNEKGNRELYLRFDDGIVKRSLPIMQGMTGPVVGDADYNWQNMDAETRSGLVERSWDSIDVRTRRGILRADIEKMLELYGGQ